MSEPDTIGSVESVSRVGTVTPTLTASSAYTAGNCVGGLLTFTGMVRRVSAILQSIHVSCKTVQTGGLKLYMFNSNPSATTFTNKTAPSLNAADVAKCIGVFTLSTPDNGLGTHTVWNLDGIGKAFVLPTAGAPLYGLLVTSGTPTFGSTSDVVVNVITLAD